LEETKGKKEIKTEFWNPDYIVEIDWEEYDRVWESKWKYFN